MLAVILNIIAIIFSLGTSIFLILFIKELKSNPDKKLEEIEPKLKKLLYTVAACALMAAAFGIVGITVK